MLSFLVALPTPAGVAYVVVGAINAIASGPALGQSLVVVNGSAIQVALPPDRVLDAIQRAQREAEGRDAAPPLRITDNGAPAKGGAA